jgi:hypothetical protein
VLLRGDAPYLTVIEPGRLLVYEIAWDTSSMEGRLPKPVEIVTQSEPRARTVFQRLSTGRTREERQGKFIHDLLFNLLNETINNLLEAKIQREDAISLAGRALFARFLIDRGILQEENLRDVCPTARDLRQIFTGPERVQSTCQWLHRKFNGDLLPLSSTLDFSSKLHSDAFGSLENIVQGARGGQLRFDWGDVDFAHVPVGLLSQVYERQAETWDVTGRRRDSVYYTPQRIAEYMVRQVFASMEQEGDVPPHEVRVLDPAAGGGVFLVSAFQEITAAWWRHQQRPPNTRELRSILYRQLCGFDISEPALRFTALSLYLKAIELDLDPHPIEKLRFEPLRGKVLHSVRRPGEKAGIVPGSLGQHLDPMHNAYYDLVIGNPPWTSLEGRDGRNAHASMVSTVRPIVAARLGETRATDFHIPDQVPDLPFVWRAMEWTKPSGWIAFALHGRLLFKSSHLGTQARNDLFQAMEVTGILNGADLRQTDVWPNVTAPFCLLFARNRPASPEHEFLFVSPYREETLNRQGRLRVDPHDAHPVSVRKLITTPKILKMLFRGTALDAGVLERISHHRWPAVADYFSQYGLGPREGYQVVQGKNDASFLQGLPDLTARTARKTHRFLVSPSDLPKFDIERLHRPRQEAIYKAPLVLVKEKVPLDRSQGRALCSFSDTAYSESFYGCSTFGHPEAEDLARYLFLLLHGEIFLWYLLVTSSKLGVERDTVLKEDFADFPLPPMEDMPSHLRAEIRPLSDALFADTEPWTELDDWVRQVYRLSHWDLEVILDTISIGLPHQESRRRAQRTPHPDEIQDFVSRVEQEVQPFAQAAGRTCRVEYLQYNQDEPWAVIRCALSSKMGSERPSVQELGQLFARADQEGASQIILVQPKREQILIALLLEYRYWTASRARLCALEILEEHFAGLLEAR